jgi:glutathione S-transferase
MLKLYHLPISFNSRRVWVALLEKGLDFELIPMKLDGDQLQPEFLAMNPFHHIPVLVDGDFTLIESFAILDYLEAKYPSTPLLPKDPQLLGIVKMVQMVTINELLPEIRPLMRQKFGFIQLDDQQVEQSQQKVATVLTFLEKLLDNRSYFGGDSLSLAEIVTGTITPLLPGFGVSLDIYPQLMDWTKCLTERETWQKTEPKPEEIEEFKATMQKLMAQRNK